MRMLERLRRQKLSPAKIIVGYYFIAVTVSILLLSLPFSRQSDAEWTFIDALFTSVSAVSVTGLSTISIKDTFTVPGYFILSFILQFGGIGIMTLSTFIWLVLRRRIGLKERRLIMTDQNQSSLSGLVSLLKQILILILAIEIVGGIILGTYMLKYFPDWKEAYLHGFFASVSATTNAGFDITGESLIPFAKDYFIQFINILLLTLGAIGFPVLIEVKAYLFHEKKHRFTLFSKVTSITFLGLLAFGTIGILLLDSQHFFKGKPWHESLFYALFQSSTTRSGGLATMDVAQFSDATLLFMCLLMVIGASPSSVGGGIRTTTFALNLLFIYHFARGRKSVKLFKREVHHDDITKSLVVTIVAALLCFVSTVILAAIEPFSLLEILFEVSSAFGTTGLSLGITADLSTPGKVIIILLMFIGRIGIVTFLLMMGKKEIEANYKYPTERIIIG
ncbi:TrkH family potassium uptake protein [Bacillus sp. FJAT-42376]|uniref:TrkH family potassium uptake protein n=1 Tax=Bacillus sp. FJAT-42376 TaxID=2014076 RepID=UPI000F4F0C8A|nr:TrkH family potassium uptake protein [Bacillus sp. FJAT-42376]AZB42521.1 TrkH family potassium uptake protein [Bacillus sp. FJAT-42376]